MEEIVDNIRYYDDPLWKKTIYYDDHTIWEWDDVKIWWWVGLKQVVMLGFGSQASKKLIIYYLIIHKTRYSQVHLISTCCISLIFSLFLFLYGASGLTVVRITYFSYIILISFTPKVGCLSRNASWAKMNGLRFNFLTTPLEGAKSFNLNSQLRSEFRLVGVMSKTEWLDKKKILNFLYKLFPIGVTKPRPISSFEMFKLNLAVKIWVWVIV